MTHTLSTKARRYATRLTIVFMACLFAFGSSPAMAVGPSCPNGTSDLDCASVINNWPAWIPNSCTQSVPDSSLLDNHSLPADSGKAAVEPSINNSGTVDDQTSVDYGKSVAFSQYAGLGPAYQSYYIAMRWKYDAWNWDGTNRLAKPAAQAELDWMQGSVRPKLILITNPANGKSVIAAALQNGPAPWMGVDTSPNNTPKQGWVNPTVGTPLAYEGDVSGLTQAALDALGAKPSTTPTNGDSLNYSWAPDQNATPGPTTASPAVSNAQCTPGTTLDGVVFMSQRDPRWKGQSICWGSGACDSVYNEGCWATSVAMIISTFKSRVYPNEITPMQTEGSAKPHEAFYNNDLNDYWYPDVTTANFDKAISAVRQGALVLLHGSGRGPDGGPFYNTPTHYEVLRGVSSDGQSILVNDPWDLPSSKDPSQPDPAGHSLRIWPRRDVQPYLLDFQIVIPRGKTLNI